jgi:DNA polymerase I-like protein with 3'-5' exonuclease and polymerase domains/uracil-DNA glycosylase
MKRWHGQRWKPVPMQRAKGVAKGLFLGEAPAKHEVKKGAPFVGESGKELHAAFSEVGIVRTQWHLDNVIACRANVGHDGKDYYDGIDYRLRKEKKLGWSPDHEQHPAWHCAPRLEKSLALTDNIVTLGTKAARAVLPGNPSILSIRGGPVEPKVLDRRVKVLPTVHPAFVRRARRWRRVFQADLRRALRYFDGNLQWSDPVIYYEPSPDLLRWFLSQSSPYWSYDVETDAKEPLWANLRCIGVSRDATEKERENGYEDAAIIVPFRLINGDEYPEAEWLREYSEIFKEVFADGRLWVAHNGGWYDRLVVENCLGITPAPLLDTILLARLVASELPKSLGVVGSIYTDVSSWKADNEGNKLSTDAQSDEELWHYNAMDCAVTHRILPPLWKATNERGQAAPCPARPDITLVELDHSIQGVCAGMSKVGMFIDQTAQVRLEHELDAQVVTLHSSVVSLAQCGETFNPASTHQVRDLLYTSKGFGLEPLGYTKTGDPSTGNAILLEYLMNPGTPPKALEFIAALRAYRAKSKLLTTFVRPLKPRTAGGVIDPDGRLRVAWSSHIPVSGRLASSQPMNVQNWPKALRKLVIPEPGHVLVGADFDQLEGRISAARWGMESYLTAYRQAGVDAHQITMEFCFGERIWKMGGAPTKKYLKKGIGGKFNDLRNLCKGYLYAKIYGSGDETVWGLLRQAEDEDGGFLNKDLKLPEVAAMSRRFLEQCPELLAGWEAEINYFNDHGHNAEPITGRRRDFLDGFEKNEIVNFPVQSSAAALMNLATYNVVRGGITAHYSGLGTGPIQQGHDALVLEVPADEAEEARKFLEICMTQHYPDIYDVTFTASAEIGHSWYEV